ncbi:neprosin family prolyl endopeptidase [Paracidovorax anthurii]|uniref:Uncharacterized protein DUF239 n=1 Tax=Paracidovorax anthurii TaxID=78229 RepID=A0A328Z141_9BURK|nr:neprosin family prolyl endopeptidase [Paracidovorax anthurii]RAR79163.1 uncharacterized protein DUF239 [Paracidovorax anthurii]
MSISQIWVMSADSVQTLEVGWQRRPSYPKWGNKSILFIYSTQNGYRTGCHNLECGQFVQTASGNVFGVAFAANRYSVKNGAQGVVKVAFERNQDGNWWLSVDGHWIGYYKASLYTGGDLASPNASIAFWAGGETYADDNAPSTPMGSGAFAASGYRQAAFQANHFYIDDSLKAHAVTHLKDVSSTAPRCYTVAVAGLSYDSGTGVSRTTPSPEMTTGGFYFGGPGCH